MNLRKLCDSSNKNVSITAAKEALEREGKDPSFFDDDVRVVSVTAPSTLNELFLALKNKKDAINDLKNGGFKPSVFHKGQKVVPVEFVIKLIRTLKKNPSTAYISKSITLSKAISNIKYNSAIPEQLADEVSENEDEAMLDTKTAISILKLAVTDKKAAIKEANAACGDREDFGETQSVVLLSYVLNQIKDIKSND